MGGSLIAGFRPASWMNSRVSHDTKPMKVGSQNKSPLIDGAPDLSRADNCADRQFPRDTALA